MKFLPSASELIRLDRLPDFFNGIKGNLQDLLDDLRLKEYQVERHPYFGGGSWYVILRTTKRIELEVFGTGLIIVFNPSLDPSAPGSETDIPLSLSIKVPILDYIRNFRLEEFAGSPESLFKLIAKVTGADELGLTESAILNVVAGAMSSDLVAAINVHYSLSPPLTPVLTGDAQQDAAAIGEAVEAHPALAANDKDMLDVLVETFILDPNPPIAPRDFVEKVFAPYFSGPVVDSVAKLFLPRIDASIRLSAGLEFPRDYLVPIKADGEVEEDENVKTVLLFSAGEFRYSTEGLIGFTDPLIASFPPSHPKAQIGSTALTIGFTSAKLDLSREKNIPEAIAEGRPDDFIGVFIEQATIGFPAFWKKESGSTAEITGKRLLIGTGGFSGTVGLDVTNGSILKATLGSGFTITLDAFDMTFRQNVITASTIHGSMLIPGFKDSTGADAKIDIGVHIGGDGDFKVSASNAAGVRIGIPNILNFDITEASVERKGQRFFFAVVGRLEFADQGGVIGQFLPDKIEIKKLLIWDDGKIELEGGKITLPRAVSLKVGPVKLSVTAIGFGSHEQMHKGVLRRYKYFTFDGGVNVNPGGVDVSGSGIAFYYTVDNDANANLPPHRFMRIQSIAIDLVIPGSASKDSAVLLLKGYLSMRAADPPSSGTEYAGSIAFTLPKLKMGGAASMRFNPDVPAFLIDVGLEISTPILLGSTGLGIFGFRGLLGLRYVASKNVLALQLTDADPWWKYYKKKIAPDNREGIQVSKFAQIPGFSLGAGVSLATASDTGYTLAAKIFFLLSLPDVFLLQGQAQILKGRILLTDKTDPPFFALIAITKNSVETAFGVKYAVPDDDGDGKKAGGVVTVDAVIEMGFFWGNGLAWYLNIGRETPASERVLVRLLSLIDAYFYFMISNSGIRAGAGASYHLSKKFGPLSAELHAYLDTAGRISFRPKQIGASIRIGGNVELSIFGFGFGISAAASLAAEGTKPFTVTGSIEVCVRVLRKDRCAKFAFTWIFNQSLDLSETKLLKDNLQESGKALNIHTQETYELWPGTSLPADPSVLDAYMIPLDSYIDIEFMKGVNPSTTVQAAFGGNTMGSDYVEFVAPQRGKTDRVRHEYTLDAVEIYYHDGLVWKPYDIYGAAVPPQLTSFITSNQSTLKQGFWQYQQPKLHNKLRVLAQTPLTYVSQGSGDFVPEDSGITTESIFCAPNPIAETCTNFDDLGLPKEIVNLPERRRFFHHQFQFRVTGADGRVLDSAFGNFKRAVRLDAVSALEIFLTEPAVLVRLKVKATTDHGVVRYFRREALPPSKDGLADAYDYVLVATRSIGTGAPVEVLYDDDHGPVDKIVVEAGACSAGPPLVCDPALTPQARDLERFLALLVDRGEHTSAGAELLLHDYQVWDGVFFTTSLHAAPDSPDFYRYSLVSSDDTELHGRLTDWKGFSCLIDLTLIEGARKIDWTLLIVLRNLRADPQNVAGTNYTFLIDGEVLTSKGPQRVTFRGRSCYPITHCTYVGVPTPGPLTAEADALGGFLDHLASNNHLGQPRLKLSRQETDLYDRAFNTGRTLPSSGRKIWLTATRLATTLPRLQISFSDGTTEGTVSLTLPRPLPSFTFDAVTGFSALRPDGNLMTGPDGSFLASGFLVDARVRTRDGESTVVLRGEAPFAITTVDTQPTIPSTVAVSPAIGETVLPRAASPPRVRPPRQPAECAVYVYEVCVLDLPSAAFNDTLPTQSSVDAEVASIVQAFQGSIQPLWRPYTRFAIRVTTRDSLYREGSSNPETVYPSDGGSRVFGFSTAGPLGHFHIYRDENGNLVPRADFDKLDKAGHGDEFKLVGLLHYLDFAKSYPNADGQLINAKPLFFTNPKLLLFYLQTYVARMFCEWAPWGGLKKAEAIFDVVVKDPAPDPSVADPGPVEATWKLSPMPLVSQDVTILNNMIAHGSPCGTVTEIHPTWLYSEFPLDTQQLQPLKRYTAIFRLRFKKPGETDFTNSELLRYGFQTSRYASLAEQVGSYKLKVAGDGTVLRAAVFEAGKAFDPAQIAVAASIVGGSMAAGDPLKQAFADPFNRIFEGALKMEALQPPQGTEFNLVRDTTTSRLLGILIRNPEPFNDPKLPATEVETSIRLSLNGGSESDFIAIHSKDLSQVFVTNADGSMSLPAGATCAFTFDYKQWDGAAYAPVESAQAVVVLP